MSNNSLMVISYNEGEQDFKKEDIQHIYDENINESSPDIIVLCTQKSKSQVAIALPGFKRLTGSNSTKHFPHVFGNILISKQYDLIDKKDASFMLRGVTENNNVRTRVYMKRSVYTQRSLPIIFTLSAETIGQTSTMTLNRQAIMTEFTYNKKNIVIISNNNSLLHF